MTVSGFEVKINVLKVLKLSGQPLAVYALQEALFAKIPGNVTYDQVNKAIADLVKMRLVRYAHNDKWEYVPQRTRSFVELSLPMGDRN